MSVSPRLRRETFTGGREGVKVSVKISISCGSSRSQSYRPSGTGPLGMQTQGGTEWNERTNGAERLLIGFSTMLYPAR